MTCWLLLDSDCSGSTFNDLPPVTYFKVFNLLKSMVPKSSPMDFIPMPLMVSCSNVISHLIAHLVNLSFAEGCFPSCFKSALVMPLLKKPNLDPGNLSNFRPISNLSNISKILESLFLTCIKNHIASSPNFSPYQSVYREGYSTETAHIHSGHFHSTSSRPALLRGAPNYSTDSVSEFHTEAHSQLKTLCCRNDFHLTYLFCRGRDP